jgi:25S rRNA (adenine2142-N1)-methyltransferase
LFLTLWYSLLQRERDLATEKGDLEQVKQCDQQLEEMGGREEYQRASQLSTSFHSTSKWVLGNLARNGWLYGTPVIENENDNSDTSQSSSTKTKKRPRRNTRLLEVGAINTELLDAAMATVAATTNDKQSTDDEDEEEEQVLKYKIDVRAIDIHSMDERIAEADFLTFPLLSQVPNERYDVIVCSMVLNCVTTPPQRGKMLARLYQHLRPGGLLFLTIPLFCITRSAFLTPALFREMLGVGGVGFDLEETKESPRLAFFVCRRPQEDTTEPLKPKWTKQTIRNKGKKFPNQFSVVLEEDEVFGRVKI